MGTETLAIAWNSHLTVTREQPPSRSFTIPYPALDPDWGFDFDRGDELVRRLRRLAALYAL